MTGAGEPVRRRSVWPPLVLAAALLGVWAWRRGPEWLSQWGEGEGEGASAGAGEPSPSAAEQFWPYAAPARALLGGLEVGDPATADWEVLRVEGPLPDERIKVTVARAGVSLAIWVVPRGRSRNDPPAQTRDYALFYDRPQPPDASVDAAVILALVEFVAARVSANE